MRRLRPIFQPVCNRGCNLLLGRLSMFTSIPLRKELGSEFEEIQRGLEARGAHSYILPDSVRLPTCSP
jgi:hypothetical protein